VVDVEAQAVVIVAAVEPVAIGWLVRKLLTQGRYLLFLLVGAAQQNLLLVLAMLEQILLCLLLRLVLRLHTLLPLLGVGVVWVMVLLLELEVLAVVDKTDHLVLLVILLQYPALLFKATQAVQEITQAHISELAVEVVQEAWEQMVLAQVVEAEE